MQRTHCTNLRYEGFIELDLEIECTFNRLRQEQKAREGMEHKRAKVSYEAKNGSNGGNDGNVNDL